MLRIIVTGDRNLDYSVQAERLLFDIINLYGTDLIIINGGCSGVDESFKKAAEHHGVSYETYEADWAQYGNAAGPIRNRSMIVSGADFLIAVHYNLQQSKGTKDCVRRALAAKIPVFLVDRPDGTLKSLRSL